MYIIWMRWDPGSCIEFYWGKAILKTGNVDVEEWKKGKKSSATVAMAKSHINPTSNQIQGVSGGKPSLHKRLPCVCEYVCERDSYPTLSIRSCFLYSVLLLVRSLLWVVGVVGWLVGCCCFPVFPTPICAIWAAHRPWKNEISALWMCRI